ncbi:thioredoxin, putative [Eimeria necatrix]|uniref:Thioredoxin, putative n=1 Tax=Eimeria necatrix TaxID=51315 RepID=U6MG84_9EIME|nr:thioredoxin, putative [Eimeria necatrix]CDJ62058.1 thioredoxin, putative [Eimeria necatrix]
MALGVGLGKRSLLRSFAAAAAPLLLLLLLLQQQQAAAARPLIDPMQHSIGLVSEATWSGKVLKFRDSSVFAVLFFDPSSADTPALVEVYEHFAKKMKGFVQVLAVDCSHNSKLCKEHAQQPLPQIVIFPPFPLPQFAYQGPKDVESLSKAVRPLIPSNVKSVANQKELEALIASTVQMPKALFFSDKLTKPSILLKALSNAFKDKLAFVLLNKDAFPEAVKKYKVTSFPHLVVVRKDKKDEVYKGAFEFQKLFDWLNVFSETFVMGGGFSDTAPPAEIDPELQPWKVEPVPELTKQSSQDICFKKSNKFVCVMLAKRGRQLTTEEQEMMESLKEDYEGHQDKGPDFRFMWIDLDTETEWAELFDIKNTPTVVAVNPHKKVRFLKLAADLPATKPHIRKMLGTISSGDARFKIVPQAKVPKFVDRKEAKEDAKKPDTKKEEL